MGYPASTDSLLLPPKPGSRYIALTKGKWAIVDGTDYEWLSKHLWHTRCCRGRCYAATIIDGKAITMHRIIMNPPPSIQASLHGQLIRNRRGRKGSRRENGAADERW